MIGFLNLIAVAYPQFIKIFSSVGAYSIAQTQDGGFAITGGPYLTSISDILLARFDSGGRYLWAEHIGGLESDCFDVGFSIVQTSDKGFAVSGITDCMGPSRYNLILTRFDSLGNHLWTKVLGDNSILNTNTVVQTTDKGFVVVNRTNLGVGGGDILVLRFDSLGNLLWLKTLGGTGEDYNGSIALTADGGIVIVGKTTSFGAGGSDILIVKLDSLGDLLWARTFGGTGEEEGKTIVLTTEGGFTVAGNTTSFGAGGSDILVARFDSLGNLVWARTIGETGDESGSSIVQNPGNGGFTVAGNSTSFGASGSNIILVRLDSIGNCPSSWIVGGGAEGDDFASSIVRTLDGSFMVAGATWRPDVIPLLLIFLRFDSLGVTCAGSPISMNNSSPSFLVDTPALTMTIPVLTILDTVPQVTPYTPLWDSVLCEGVGIDESGATPSGSLTLFPAPSGFYISGYSGEARIYDPTGRLVLAREINGKTLINPVRPGVYFVVAGKHRARVSVR